MKNMDISRVWIAVATGKDGDRSFVSVADTDKRPIMTSQAQFLPQVRETIKILAESNPDFVFELVEYQRVQ